MLRINFTSDDISRTRLAPAPDPLWELVLAAQMLRPQRGDLLFTGWRREATDVLRRADLGASLRLLLALTPNVGYFPDFLNPVEATRGLEYGLEAIRCTPKEALRRDMSQLARSRRLPAYASEVTEGDPGVLVELTGVMQKCHDLVVTPYQRATEAAINRDRAIRVNALANGGVEAMLASLHPMLRWSSGELLVPSHRDQELDLGGRGLLLIPSYFCVSGPLTLLDPTLTPVLVYPVERWPHALSVRDQAPSASLAALIGPTRAAVLQAVHTRLGTTSDLARRVKVSIASASAHATVLREAGLITSHRDGNRMLHHPTPLGLALLETNQTRYARSGHGSWSVSGMRIIP